jgi:hypothetical protein
MMTYVNVAFLGCSSNRGIKTARHVVTRKSKAPAILVEVCFLTNACQQGKIANSGNQALVAEGIAVGMTWAISPVCFFAPNEHASTAPIVEMPYSMDASLAVLEPLPAPEGNPLVAVASLGGLTFSEDFEGATFPPSGWGTQTSGAPPPYTWARTTDPDYLGSGGGSALVQGGYGAPSDEWLVSPLVNLAASDRGLRFSWSGSRFWASALDATCSIRPGGSGPWTALWSLAADEPQADPFVYRERVVDLTPWIGTSVQFGFRIQGTNGADFGLDDVSVGDFAPTGAPANDLCAGATLVPHGDFQFSGVTCYATNQTDPYQSDGNGCVKGELSGPDVIYLVQAGAGDTLMAQVSGLWNPAVYLLDACGGPSPACVAAAYPVDGSLSPSFILPFSANGTFYLVVDGAQGSCGPFTLSGFLRGSPAGAGDRPADPSRGGARLLASPNPSRAIVRFSAYLPSVQRGAARLSVYDLSGRKILEHLLNVLNRESSFDWDLRDERGIEVSAGIYYAEIEAEGVRSRCRVVVLR